MANKKFLTQSKIQIKNKTHQKKKIEIFFEAQTSKILKERVKHKVKSMSLSKSKQR